MTTSDKNWCNHMVKQALQDNYLGETVLWLHTSEEKAAYVVFKLSKYGEVVHKSQGKTHEISVTFS